VFEFSPGDGRLRCCCRRFAAHRVIMPARSSTPQVSVFALLCQ